MILRRFWLVLVITHQLSHVCQIVVFLIDLIPQIPSSIGPRSDGKTEMRHARGSGGFVIIFTAEPVYNERRVFFFFRVSKIGNL